MSLKHAILVLLETEDGSGYDLLKRFRARLGFFWQATHQQIYHQLKQLNQHELIHFETVAQEGKPDRKVYSVTEEGRQELLRWLSEISKPQKINDSLLVKLYGGHLIDQALLLEDIRTHQEQHRRTLSLLKEMESRFNTMPSQEQASFALPFLTLRKGILGEEAWLRWSDEVVHYLKGPNGQDAE